MKKTVVLTANTSWSLYKFRKGIIERLIKDGHKVCLVSPADDFVSELKNLGAEFYILTSLKAKGLNPMLDAILTFEYYKIYKKIKPDIIFSYTIKPNLYSTLSAKLLRIKSIAVITGLGYAFINKGFVNTLVKILYRFLLRFSYKVWFLNNDDMQLFKDLKIVNGNQMKLVPGEGIDTNYFNANQSLVSKFHKTKFLFIGRLLTDKGICEYYEAAKAFKEKRNDITFGVLGFIGSNNPKALDRNLLNDWIESDVIEYYGEATDVRPFIEAHSCVVLPSYREGLSTVLLEAASMSTPLIVTNIAGCKELVVEPLNGFLVEPRSAKSLLNAFVEFEQLSTESKIKMGEYSRMHILNYFSINKVYQFYKETIETE